MALLIGTNNPGKLREYGEIFAPAGIAWMSLRDAGLTLEPDEPFDTFTANATHKATLFARSSGMMALADDSGLSIDALDGRPGVFSARYAGLGASDDDRMNRVLAELSRVPDEQRGAQFVCVAALATPDGRVHTETGIVRGRIGHVPGDRTHGFGYDPIFIPEGHERVFSALPPAVKHQISHRGRAAAAILPTIREWLAQSES
jgi:XTP/dITP diphosphohydrolase